MPKKRDENSIKISGKVTASKKSKKKTVSKRASRKSVKQKPKNTTKQASKKPATTKQSKSIKHLEVTDTTPKERSIKISTSRLQLALLSPFRFPLNQDRIAAQTARYAGIFFVVVGAIFTIINMQVVTGFNTQALSQSSLSANLICTTTEQCDLLYTEFQCDCRECANYDALTCEDITTSLEALAPTDTTTASADTVSTVECVDYTTCVSALDELQCDLGENPVLCAEIETRLLTYTEPAVAFSVDPSGDPLSATVLAVVSVDNAQEVELFVYHVEKQKRSSLGFLESIGTDLWGTTWNTANSEFPDGTYQFKALVTNEFGTYDQVDAVYHTVENKLITPVTDTVVPETQDVTTETVAVVALAVLDNTPLQGNATLRVKVSDATTVRLIARDIISGEPYNLGYATQDTSSRDQWSFLWNTTDYPNAEYKITAIAVVDRETHYSAAVHTKINNPLPEPEIEIIPEPPQPELSIQLPTSDSFSDTVPVYVKVRAAQFVELYLRPFYGTQPHFIGLARQLSDDTWTFDWNTKNTPNGNYVMSVRLKDAFGLYDLGSKSVVVRNEYTSSHSTKRKTYIEEVEDLQKEIVEQNTARDREAQLAPIQEVVSNLEVASELRLEIKALLDLFKADLVEYIEGYARAQRANDTDAMSTASASIDTLRDELIERLKEMGAGEVVVERIESYLTEFIAVRKEVVELNEKLIRERVGDSIYEDSDGDNVSDYDEINLYRTDPFSADTDGDGYIDGYEILGGFDPRDSAPEALVVFESPKEAGVVHDEVLAVETVTALTVDDTEGASDPETKAVFAGKGLPNSFVTLYIFSTPIVVTVKTGDDGSWTYLFDKELEDGEHEVYVGITDNAGKIVVKSNPLAFVKTAQAFTPVDAALSVGTDADTKGVSFWRNESMIFVVLSVTVVSIGLVLMLLGIHLQSRRKPDLAVTQ